MRGFHFSTKLAGRRLAVGARLQLFPEVERNKEKNTFGHKEKLVGDHDVWVFFELSSKQVACRHIAVTVKWLCRSAADSRSQMSCLVDFYLLWWMPASSFHSLHRYLVSLMEAYLILSCILANPQISHWFRLLLMLLSSAAHQKCRNLLPQSLEPIGMHLSGCWA